MPQTEDIQIQLSVRLRHRRPGREYQAPNSHGLYEAVFSVVFIKKKKKTQEHMTFTETKLWDMLYINAIQLISNVMLALDKRRAGVEN